MTARVLTDEERAQQERINGRFGDARAQLWARVYAAVYEHAIGGNVLELGATVTTTAARKVARVEADTAVLDFDEHYLGAKR